MEFLANHLLPFELDYSASVDRVLDYVISNKYSDIKLRRLSSFGSVVAR